MRQAALTGASAEAPKPPDVRREKTRDKRAQADGRDQDTAPGPCVCIALADRGGS